MFLSLRKLEEKDTMVYVLSVYFALVVSYWKLKGSANLEN